MQLPPNVPVGHMVRGQVLESGVEELPAHSNLHYPCVENFVSAALNGSPLLAGGESSIWTDWVTAQVMAARDARGLTADNRAALPPELPLVVSGRAVNLLAKPIPDAHTAADFSSVMAKMRALGVLPATPVSLVGVLPDLPQRA